MSMIVNRRDLDFVLYETLGLDKILESDRYADYDRESLDAIMDLCQTIAEDQFLPCAAKLDANEPKFVDGKVETISELKEAIAAYQEAGLCASAYDSDVGGMQLPWMMDQALNGMFVCANNPAHIYLFLTQVFQTVHLQPKPQHHANHQILYKNHDQIFHLHAIESL